MPFSRILYFALLSAALAVHARGAQPEQSAALSNAQPTVTAVQAIDDRLAEARKNLALAEALGDAALTNVPTGISLQDVATRRALVSRVVRLFEQQLSNAAELETTRSRRAELARKAQAWTRFAEPAPFSILLPDRLREEIQTEQLKGTSGEAAVSTIDQLISDNRNELTHTEERIRQVNEQLEGTKDPAGEARLLWQRELEKLRSQVAAASLGVLDSELQLRHEALEESRIRIGWLQRQLVVADAGAKFTEADLDTVTARIESARLLLEREFTETQERLTNTLQGVEAAREELGRTQSRPEASPGAIARAAEALAAREAQLQTVRESLRILRFMLESENVERAMWELRFAAYDSRSVGNTERF